MAEIVIMMGYPGSGKSTVAKKMCENPDYIYVEGDLYKKSSKMIKVAQEYVKIGKSIIFDATNGSKKKRQEYVEFAKTSGYNCVKCIHVATDLEEAYRRNMLRPEDKRVPRVAYSVYKKGFEEPSEDEGFALLTL
jgi:bifunctional polynucleotide phosphatase/kinase